MQQGVITLRDTTGTRVDATLLDREEDGSLTARWPDGRRLFVPAAAIDRQNGGDVHLRVHFGDLGDDTRPDDAPEGDAERVLPLAREEAVVDTRRETTGAVRVHTRTRERDEDVNEVLTRESVDVRRVPVDRVVDEPAPVREEGDTTVVPLHEEVLVVEKRLLLREEVHVTKRAEERQETQRVRLRSEEAEIDRSETRESDED